MSADRWIWHELAVHDLERAKDFYQEAFGWRTITHDEEPPDADTYWIWEAPEGTARCGGLYRMSDMARREAPTARWLPYIRVDDVDETAKRAEMLTGGVIAAPIDAPGVGRTAVLCDISEAPFAVIEPATEPRIAANCSDCWLWHMVATDDVRLAAAFYRGLFGWESVEETDMRLTFTADGVPVAGAFHPHHEALDDLPCQWIGHVAVADVGAVMERVIRVGAEAVENDAPGAPRTALIVDPDGAALAIQDRR